MEADNLQKIAEFINKESKSVTLKRISALILKGIAILIFVSSISSIIINGKDFFLKQIPSALGTFSKFVMLGSTFRPFLIHHILHEDFHYSNMCIFTSSILDLNGDKSSDLLVHMYPKTQAEAQQPCRDVGFSAFLTVVLKEVEWKGFWPTYNLLLLSNGNGLPMSFQDYGPFLVGQPGGIDSAWYAVYGYSSGLLHDFGPFTARGGLTETPDSPEPARIGNHLYMHLDGGFFRFTAGPDGAFSVRNMKKDEVVSINNEVLFIQTAIGQSSDATTDTITYEFINGDAYTVTQHFETTCDIAVFVNGDPLCCEPAHGEKNAACNANLEVRPTNIITADVACLFEGFVPMKQFPWGMVWDNSKPNHVIRCPIESPDFRLTVTLADDSH